MEVLAFFEWVKKRRFACISVSGKDNETDKPLPCVNRMDLRRSQSLYTKMQVKQVNEELKFEFANVLKQNESLFQTLQELNMV